MKALSVYVKFNEDRAELLDGINERGSFCGNYTILNKVTTIERCIRRVEEVIYESNSIGVS